MEVESTIAKKRQETNFWKGHTMTKVKNEFKSGLRERDEAVVIEKQTTFDMNLSGFAVVIEYWP